MRGIFEAITISFNDFTPSPSIQIQSGYIETFAKALQ
jgi:hypothetical protein